MSEGPNKLTRFWQELKRRRVLHVITVYASASFVIIELINNVLEPLNLPERLSTIAIVTLAIGFPLALILSWIFDVTPRGIEKTDPLDESTQQETARTPNSWKIATYVSVVIIVGLLVVNIFGVWGSGRSDQDLEYSIAVLPFYNQSTEPGQEIMSQGLVFDIIKHLYLMKSFEKVVPWRSVSPYAEAGKTAAHIMEELEVSYLLDGSYKKAGEKILVSVQLFQGSHQSCIWQDEYDIDYIELVGLHSEISLKIARQIDLFLSTEEKNSIQKTGTINIRAYEILQWCHYHINQGDFSLAYGDSLFKAIELDPGYADAYAALGFLAMLDESFLSGATSGESTVLDARDYIEKALDLDPDNLIANYNLGMFNLLFRWNYIDAEKLFEKGLPIIRDYPEIAIGYIEFLMKMNRMEDALSYCLSLNGCGELVRIYILHNKITEAQVLKSATLPGTGFRLDPMFGETFLWTKEYDSALFYLESALESEHDFIGLPRFQAALAMAYYQTGNLESSHSILLKIKELSDESAPGSPDYYLGWCYSWIGEVDSAFYFLEKAVRNKSPEMTWLKVDPAFDNLKDDDRYWDLYERTGHKAYDDYMAIQIN